MSVYLTDPTTVVDTPAKTKITIRQITTVPTNLAAFVKNLATASATIANLGALSLFNYLDYSAFYTQQYNFTAANC